MFIYNFWSYWKRVHLLRGSWSNTVTLRVHNCVLAKQKERHQTHLRTKSVCRVKKAGSRGDREGKEISVLNQFVRMKK